MFGLINTPGIVIPAQGKPPLFARSRPSSGTHKIGPGDFSFDRPSLVAVLVNIKRSLVDDSRGDMEGPGRDAFFEECFLPFWDKHIELGIGRIHLKFVIARLVSRWAEEQFEDVIEPGFCIVCGDIGKQIFVIKGGKEIKVLPIPQQPGTSCCFDGPLSAR